ncbi:SHOCT domain-containing protein [Halostella sp. JP-L12]|uniref:SHOCT domain-containing protein n=1 Tax=Halostella TaxID=1843185 RepID=UPI000EF7963B|nr:MULTISPECIES: SHOCT domain-containing protein [Halostella]NHN49959.1 SHOCT domain-containing protein [Halostella sp. JP-L12]
MTDPSTAERVRANATEIASTLVTGIWLAALFTGQDWWLAALLFGYVVVVPIVSLLYGDESDREEWWDDWTGEKAVDEPAERERAPDPDETALERLRRRYAEGELTDEQFERKLERLLETETLEDVEDERRSRGIERETERN